MDGRPNTRNLNAAFSNSSGERALLNGINTRNLNALKRSGVPIPSKCNFVFALN